MAISGYDAMFVAMWTYEGHMPWNLNLQNNNPLNLRNSPITHKTDSRGYCVFADLTVGIFAGQRELSDKILGRNDHHIGPESTLEALYDVYAPRADHNNPNAYAEFVAHWVAHATGRTITAQTKLRDVCLELFKQEVS